MIFEYVTSLVVNGSFEAHAGRNRETPPPRPARAVDRTQNRRNKCRTVLCQRGHRSFINFSSTRHFESMKTAAAALLFAAGAQAFAPTAPSRSSTALNLKVGEVCLIDSFCRSFFARRHVDLRIIFALFHVRRHRPLPTSRSRTRTERLSSDPRTRNPSSCISILPIRRRAAPSRRTRSTARSK